MKSNREYAFTLGALRERGSPVVSFICGFKSAERHQRFVNQKRAWKAWQTRRMKQWVKDSQLKLFS